MRPVEGGVRTTRLRHGHAQRRGRQGLRRIKPVLGDLDQGVSNLLSSGADGGTASAQAAKAGDAAQGRSSSRAHATTFEKRPCCALVYEVTGA
jgi:hypothetical protein